MDGVLMGQDRRVCVHTNDGGMSERVCGGTSNVVNRSEACQRALGGREGVQGQLQARRVTPDTV